MMIIVIELTKEFTDCFKLIFIYSECSFDGNERFIRNCRIDELTSRTDRT